MARRNSDSPPPFPKASVSPVLEGAALAPVVSCSGTLRSGAQPKSAAAVAGRAPARKADPVSTRAAGRSASGSRAEARTEKIARALPDRSRELALIATGLIRIAGIDEAGRGPLAGPVVAAAVVFRDGEHPDGIDDCKQLTRDDRERLFAEIMAVGEIAIASASAAEIDRFNIRGATLLAMRRALAALPTLPCHALIDGRDVPPRLHCPGTAVVGGDRLSASIAAASILAKVTRDRMMQRACARFPAYGFSRHMGYGTPEHLGAIARHGPSPLHRMSFRPLRQD